MLDCFPSCCLRRYVLSTKYILFLRRRCLPQMAPVLLRFICTVVTYSTDTVGIQLHCKNNVFARNEHLRWQVFIKISTDQFCPVKDLPSSTGRLLGVSIAWPLQICLWAHWWGSFADPSTEVLNFGKSEKSFLETEEFEIPAWPSFTENAGECVWTCPLN